LTQKIKYAEWRSAAYGPVLECLLLANSNWTSMAQCWQSGVKMSTLCHHWFSTSMRTGYFALLPSCI